MTLRFSGPSQVRPATIPAMRRQLVVAALCAGVLLAGCGRGDGGIDGAGGAAVEQGLVDFVRCMRRHGIQLADPVATGDDNVEVRPAKGAPVASRQEFDAATRACEADGHSRLGDGERRRLDRPEEDEAVAFARCVRREGVDLPDPRFEDGAVTNWDPDSLSIDVEAPDVVAAGERCAGTTGFDPWEDL